MDLEKFLIAVLVFVFAVFLFPTLNEQIANASLTDNVASIVSAFPIMFIIVAAVFPIYYGLKGG